MAKEDLITLFQVQSLHSLTKKLGVSIDEERKRLSLIQNQKNFAQETVNQNKSLLTELNKKLLLEENRLSVIDTNIEQNTMHIKTVSSQKQLDSIEKESQSLEIEKEKLEDSLLQKMDKIEKLEKEIKEKLIFIAGIEKSFRTIEKEVNQTISTYQIEIIKANDQAEEQLLTVNKSISDLYSNLYNDKKDLVVSYLDGNKCTLCKFQISGQIVKTIEAGIITELCPNCGLIVAPSNAKFIR